MRRDPFLDKASWDPHLARLRKAPGISSSPRASPEIFLRAQLLVRIPQPTAFSPTQYSLLHKSTIGVTAKTKILAFKRETAASAWLDVTSTVWVRSLLTAYLTLSYVLCVRRGRNREKQVDLKASGPPEQSIAIPSAANGDLRASQVYGCFRTRWV
ncbi:hypothetical protein MJT46_001872 [Ovis ammon polii x Ovis aries]|nr:hypothetical protein MJT46_001872 [Ovis ammon polii x Ovis aries]